MQPVSHSEHVVRKDPVRLPDISELNSTWGNEITR